jgi:XTP/dITP diphosphohydrolase
MLPEILGLKLEVHPMHLTEIQDLNLDNIVKHKVMEAFAEVKKPVIVEDVGLFLDAWNGFPGPFIKFIEEIVGYEKMLKMLENKENRAVTARVAVAYHDGKSVHIFHGEMKGTVARNLSDRGWGFIPILIVDEKGTRYSDLTTKEQHALSHRGKAFRKLKAFLQKSGS